MLSRNSSSGNSRVSSLVVEEEAEWAGSKGEITVEEATEDEGEEVLAGEGAEVEADLGRGGSM